MGKRLLGQGKRASSVYFSVLILASATLYLGTHLYRRYQHIQAERQRYNVGCPCVHLPRSPFCCGKWQGVVVDGRIEVTDGAHNVKVYDLDGDGVNELIANAYRADALMMYKPGRKRGDWSVDVIGTAIGGDEDQPVDDVSLRFQRLINEKLLGEYSSGAHQTAIGDLDGDGRCDLVVAADFRRDDVVAFFARQDSTNGSGRAWERHVLYRNDRHRTYYLNTGDVDGDGRCDVVFSTKTDNAMGWLINRGTPDHWQPVFVDRDCTRAFYVCVADMDADGRMEIVAAEDDAAHGGILHVYAAGDDPRSENGWMDYIIHHFEPAHGISVIRVLDMDGDGDQDVVAANHQGDVYVLLNPGHLTLPAKWPVWRISGNLPGDGWNFRDIDTGDIDGDGDIDIVLADEGGNRICWLANNGGTHSDPWQVRVVDQSDNYLRWAHSVSLGDMDGDGDLDLAVAAAAGNVFLVYFNDGVAPSAAATETEPVSGRP